MVRGGEVIRFAQEGNTHIRTVLTMRGSVGYGMPPSSKGCHSENFVRWWELTIV